MSEKTVFVAGLGKFGRAASLRLAELGQHVIAVDIDKSLVEEVAAEVEFAAQVDATDSDALEKIGVASADSAIIAMGGDFGAEVLVVAHLKALKIPEIIVRVESPMQARVMKQVGASYVVLPEREIAVQIADRIVHPLLNRFLRMGSDIMGEISPLPEMVGKSVVELSFRKRYKVVALMIKEPHEDWRLLEVDEPIQENHKLLIVGKRDNVEKILSEAEKAGKEVE